MALDFIHRFVPASNGSTRAFLLLHGTGADENNLLPIGQALDENAALLRPRGKVLENGMPRFFRRFAEGVFDEEDVIRRAHELADFVIAATDEYGLDRQQTTAVGYSNGANIAAAMMLLRPDVLPAAILFRAMVGLTDPPAADLHGTRIFISNGVADAIIPLENGERLAAMFRTRSAEVQMVVQQASHALIRDDLVAAKQWLDG